MEIIREHRLRWLGHVIRSEETDLVRVVKGIYVDGKKERKTKKEGGCNRE